MAVVRYLGIVIGDAGDFGALRAEPRLGRFVPLGEPVPVGTKVDVDGVPHLVTRVDEGVVPGCWLRGEGAAVQVIDEIPTVRESVPPPVAAPPAEPEPAAVPTPVAAKTEAAPPKSATPEAASTEAAIPDPAAPSPSDEPSTGGRRKGKRRGGKTIIGR